MKKILFTVISFLMAYNLFKPSLFASDNSLILESSQGPSIYSGHHSHSSHASHASHYSSHVNNTDSIQSLSSEIFKSLKKLLLNKQDIALYRSYIADVQINDSKPLKTLVIIGRDLSCDSNIWIYVPLTQTHLVYSWISNGYSWISNGVNRIRSNNISELYEDCPPSAHQYSLSDEILSFINSFIKPDIK